MTRPPPFATLFVTLAILCMIGLGFWQLNRRAEKAVLIDRLAANATLLVVALPPAPDEAMRFRRVTVACDTVFGWQREAGRARDGATGFRHLALCRRDNGGDVAIDMGVGTDPRRTPMWRGGMVSGMLARTGGDTSWLDRWTGRTAAALPVVVADIPAPGLAAAQPPGIDSVPNNHLAYAAQWFFFAAAAAVVYVLALRRRSR